MSRPYSINIFLPGGDPDRLRIIEKSNWSGIGLVVPRALFVEGKSRRELARTGVYVLIGPPEESGLPRIYVGEGDPIRPRLESHAAKKDFWTTCIAFTSKDEHLNKAAVQHLEAKLVELAAAAKRSALDNGNSPALPSMSEAHTADADGFLAEMLLCFPVLGVSVFTKAASNQAPERTLFLHSKGIVAEGNETSEGFLVRRGSSAAMNEVPSCYPYLLEIRRALIANGVLQPSGDFLTFTQDYVFTSPSSAAGVVLGRSSNGRTDWKTKEGKTLKAIQES